MYITCTRTRVLEYIQTYIVHTCRLTDLKFPKLGQVVKKVEFYSGLGLEEQNHNTMM